MDLATYQEAKKLYLSGLSALQVKNKLQLSLSVRQIQRIFASDKVIRPRNIAYQLAVKMGRVGAHKKESTIKRMKLPPMLRMMIFRRDNYRCQICGATGKDRLLEIDHIDFNPRNNDPQNLQVLCEWCNSGRKPNTI